METEYESLGTQVLLTLHKAREQWGLAKQPRDSVPFCQPPHLYFHQASLPRGYRLVISLAQGDNNSLIIHF